MRFPSNPSNDLLETQVAMLEKHRNTLYNHFAPQIGEEATQALMSNFPSREADEPVTKADLALTEADLQVAIAEVRTDVHDEVGSVRLELADFKTEMQHALNRQIVYFSTVITVAVGILLRAG